MADNLACKGKLVRFGLVWIGLVWFGLVLKLKSAIEVLLIIHTKFELNRMRNGS